METQAFKDAVDKRVDELASRLRELGKIIYANPELGFAEHKASRLLCDFLEEHGFEVQRGVSGLSTAFRAMASASKQGPTIGLIAEYDASPEIGHGCGHNLIGPAQVGVGAAVRELIGELSGRLVVLGVPDCEEGGGGYKVMLMKGEFRDLDAAIRFHPSVRTVVDTRPFSVRALGEAFQKNLRALGVEEDPAPPQALPALINFDPVTLVVPSLAPYVSICGQDVGRDDTLAFQRAADTEWAYSRMVVAAKATAMTVGDVLLSPEVMDATRKEFQNNLWLRYRRIITGR